MDLKFLVNENQSIKIVPSIEDIVRRNGLNTDLDNETLIKLNRLKVTWCTWKKSIALQNELQEIFNAVPDPFTTALIFIVKCDDFKDCKPKSLPYFIVDELYSWRQACGKAPDNNLKLIAFQIATHQRHQDFLNLVVKTYLIKTEKTIVLPLVQDMLKQGLYKQALQSVISVELCDDIPVVDLLFPLVLQDKGSMVDDYLKNCPHRARPFVLYLDHLLDRSCSIRDTIDKYVSDNYVTDVKWDKLHYKPIGKLVGRLCNKFQIPLNDCKNLSKNRTTGGLRYLIIQKYKEKSISDSAWHDLIKDSLDQNPETAEEFIDMLAEYDQTEALKWAEYLNIPVEKYPSNLAHANIDIDKPLESENWDIEPGTSQEYYKLELNEANIYIIDDAEKFRNFLEVAMKNVHFVGIDSEWKPSFGATQSKVALIQIATTENVYLIDCTMMNTQEFRPLWQALVNNVLDNAEIVKVGFELKHDFREMKNTFATLGNLKIKGVEGILDLAVLWKNLVKIELQFPYANENGGASLSSLTQACFGLPLKKHEQCSNWEIRPLRQSQIEYAALDAHVLIQIHTFLQELCHQQNIKFDDICYNVMIQEKVKYVKKNKALKNTNLSTNTTELDRSVSEIKFLVDPSLFYLIPYLRLCGISSTQIPGTMLWHNVVNLAISDKCFILLSKMKNSPTTNYPQSNIYQVELSELKQQLLEILKHFNLKITPEDLFKRCVLCNSKYLTTMLCDEVQAMYAAYSEYKRTYTYNTSYSGYQACRDDLDPEGFLSDYDSDEELYQPLKVVHEHENEPPSTKTWLTKSGTEINIEEASALPTVYDNPITLCEDCGKLYWNENHPIPNVGHFINDLPLC